LHVRGQAMNSVVLRYEVVRFPHQGGLNEVIVLFVSATHPLMLNRDHLTIHGQQHENLLDIIAIGPQLKESFGDLVQKLAREQHSKALILPPLDDRR
jgi:hypothetical protein